MPNFDYSLYSDKERTNYISTQDLTNCSAAQLELAANYILFGKDATHTNAIQQKKLLKPRTNHTTYDNKRAASLDELQAQPNYVERENSLKPYDTKNTYINPRPTIDRAADAAIPTMGELWDSIDRMDRQIKLGEHKLSPATPQEEQWVQNCTSLLLYKLRHWLVDLRKHQYYLKAYYKPTIPAHHSFPQHSSPNWESNASYYRAIQNLDETQRVLGNSNSPDALRAREDTQALLLQAEQVSTENSPNSSISSNSLACARRKILSQNGVVNLTPLLDPPCPLWDFLLNNGENPNEDKWYWYITYGGIPFRRQKNTLEPLIEWEYVVKEHKLDLTNPHHIMSIFKFYSSLRESSWDELDGQMKYILMTFDDLQDKSNLTPIQQHILDRQVLHYTNGRIKEELLELYGADYNRDYISSMFRTICNKIARTAAIEEEKFKWRDTPSKWKVCKCCGEHLLATTDFFVRKAENADGLASRCKKCDKRIRDQKKEGKQNG